jgi:hypothetical protein
MEEETAEPEESHTWIIDQGDFYLMNNSFVSPCCTGDTSGSKLIARIAT